MAETYFALKPAPDAASDILAKIGSWSDQLNSTGYLDKLKSSWAAYFGAYYTDVSSGHQMSFGGEQGELVNFPVNHYRNIASHIVTMITSARPAMDARAINTDYKSIIQAKLANGILDYYLREKRLERYLKQAVEHAVVMGAGFIKLEWNATTGEIFDYMEKEGPDGTMTPDANQPIYDGDIEFSNISPFDIVMDASKENNNHDWYVIRTFKNKYDLAAKYPENSDKIIGLPSKSDLQRFTIGLTNLTEETDDVPVYEFYHKKTDAMPNGRYMLLLSQDLVLQDIGLPYRVMPIFRISAGDILGTPYGYTAMFDALPLQENLNSLYSTVASNQNAFGVQNIWMKSGSNIEVDSLVGSLNVIKSQDKPEALNLTATPKEIFDFIAMIKADMETITGVNSVARGDPQASLRTGAALALVQSMALQFMSGLQQSYVELIEDVGTSIIRILQDYAKTPRLVAIVGKSNKTELKEFQGDDISNICRVYVDVGNPLSKTIAGRMELASQMLQYQVIKNPNQIIQVLNTGSLESLDEDVEGELNLIKEENEALMDGTPVTALAIDDHKQHVWEHRKPLQDPELRRNPALVQRVLAHIQEHITLLQNTDPELLQLMMQQPMAKEFPPGSGNTAPPQGPNGPPQAQNGPPQGPPGPPQQGQPQGGPPQGPQKPHGNPHNAPVPKVPNSLIPPQPGLTGVAPSAEGKRLLGPGLGQQGVQLPQMPRGK